jgi:hypothetical protein
MLYYSPNQIISHTNIQCAMGLITHNIDVIRAHKKSCTTNVILKPKVNIFLCQSKRKPRLSNEAV